MCVSVSVCQCVCRLDRREGIGGGGGGKKKRHQPYRQVRREGESTPSSSCICLVECAWKGGREKRGIQRSFVLLINYNLHMDRNSSRLNK